MGINVNQFIRENITPIGDGNSLEQGYFPRETGIYIRENITPIGDGNQNEKL